MNARVHTLMQLQIMHIPGICIYAFRFSLSLSLSVALLIHVELSMNNGRTECYDLSRVINKDIPVPLTKPRSANLHPALN